jgi:uncharacterized protein involved in type VI secretion and phage assembly
MPCSKHRGVVVNNLDPLQIGRLMVDVPGVLSAPAFAMPCVPYAGPGVGFVALPPIGANVWVEFENDDPAAPIWTGCFWSPGDVPAGAGTPEKKVFHTDAVTLTMDDSPGAGFSLVVDAPAASTTLTLTIAANGITISNGAGASVTMQGPVVSINNDVMVVT